MVRPTNIELARRSVLPGLVDGTGRRQSTLSSFVARRREMELAQSAGAINPMMAMLQLMASQPQPSQQPSCEHAMTPAAALASILSTASQNAANSAKHQEDLEGGRDC